MTVRTLHISLRGEHLERSLAFYTAVGYRVLGAVDALRSVGSGVPGEGPIAAAIVSQLRARGSVRRS